MSDWKSNKADHEYEESIEDAEYRLKQAKLEATHIAELRANEDLRRQVVFEKERRLAEVERLKQREILTKKINDEVFHCIETEDDEELIRLLEGGADVNHQNNMKRCPLSLAVIKGSPALVRILLKYNANVNLEDLYCQTPLSFAIKYKRHAEFELMQHSQRANVQVGAFMYQQKLNEEVSDHRYNMILREEERIREAELYAISRKPKKKTMKELYGSPQSSPTKKIDENENI